MLLDTVKRHDSQGVVKLACIESLRAKKQPIPQQIHSVPALLLLPNKQFLFGKNVFDYLLLPGSGKLLTSMGPSKSDSLQAPANVENRVAANDEPSAYSMTSSNSLSDNFAMIEEEVHPMQGLQDRAYVWASLQDSTDKPATVYPDTPLQEETRSRKTLPDLDSLRAQREMELKETDINNTQLIPPSFTR